MNKIDTAAQREARVMDLARKITKRCNELYGRLNEQQRTVLMVKLDMLDKAMNDYRTYDVPWDSQLIKVAQKIGGSLVQGEAISTFDSVMDHARGVFSHLVLPDDE